ncbi:MULTISPECIES: DUF1801 domain-containing protein [unclassified Leeuwenhoekiella]|uniref:DUF1801 domain-containing protein n=1 Tax=unclassified Leeuwenhoekiella TaxID=2615029 RepID=UPI000C3E1BFB|nr:MULTISPECIES: DUF1801 domain-containing protein [unclassified Leeuwenhoekiella]MAW94123.1 2-dehydro-3-deoxyphosphooctonate aldolase [Leeuwenhoekiella sp.]MBA82420.1 2-dehydro-3-deoxyphosphooctonate aldolase [Leeuwenhoekiella sp.]|tara:strand:+ start:22808 stop:23158 length:351 start_codon:yes stop_codon:yes gene_type:complete
MNPAENYILKTPQPYCAILLELQVLIEHSAPEAQLLFKWHLPFYYLDGKMFCFLNFRKRFVDLSFVYGTDLNDPDQHLVAGENRKRLRSLRYHNVDEIDAEVVIGFLEQMKTFLKS